MYRYTCVDVYYCYTTRGKEKAARRKIRASFESTILVDLICELASKSTFYTFFVLEHRSIFHADEKNARDR